MNDFIFDRLEVAELEKARHSSDARHESNFGIAGEYGRLQRFAGEREQIPGAIGSPREVEEIFKGSRQERLVPGLPRDRDREIQALSRLLLGACIEQ